MVNKEFACTECHLILPSKKEGRKDIAPNALDILALQFLLSGKDML